MKKVSGPQVVTTAEASESPQPAEIQEALGELVGAAREGLLALSVGLGLGVVHELMEREVDEIVGPKGKHHTDRTAKRHGHEDGSMTLGGRRVPVRRPRMRTAEWFGTSSALPAPRWAGRRDAPGFVPLQVCRPRCRPLLLLVRAGVTSVASAVSPEQRSASRWRHCSLSAPTSIAP